LIIGVDANRLAQRIRSTTLGVMVSPFYQESFPISIANCNAFRRQVLVSQQLLTLCFLNRHGYHVSRCEIFIKALISITFVHRRK
jgi:hypothetical protein